MLAHYRHIKVVRYLGVILLIFALVGVTQAQDRREQARQRRAQATRHVPQRRHAPAAQARQPARRQAASRPARQASPPRANTRPSPPTRSRVQSNRPTVRSTPTRPSLRMQNRVQRRSSVSSRPSITPQRPSTGGSASQRVESLRRSFRSHSQANIRRYVIDNNNRFRASTPSSSVRVDRSRRSSIFSNPRTSQPLNTRNPSALLGRRDRETPEVNTSTTPPTRTGIQDNQRDRRRSVTLFRSRNERNAVERQGTTGTGTVRRGRSITTSREGSDLLQRLRQGRSRAQANTGIRRYEPISPGTRQRAQVRTNQRDWQNRTRAPRQRVRVDASYHRQQARQFRFKRHYPRTIVYHDRCGRIDHSSSYFHVYSRRNRLFHRIVWPNFRFCVAYGYGHRPVYRHVYPHYHRKYVFVSLGGYWPGYDDCLRYYWYGWHPYQWYGYDPIPRQVNNYYTYNYYNEEELGVNATALENLEPSPPPSYQGPGDQYFEQGVVAFEDGDYLVAANLFRQVMQLDPNDIIVPFAYTQALSAEKEYLLAVMALRGALDKIDPNNHTIFYPRGLYADDETLFGQIDELMSASDRNPQDRNLKLLIGYHLLGVGEIDSAAGYLEQAGRDPNNAKSARLLLDLIQTVRQGRDDTEVSEIEP